MRTKLRFTKLALDAVTCPPDLSKVRLRDTEVPALTLVVLATGGKVYRLYKKINGRPVEVRIGGYDECTIDQARRRAVELVGQYIAGKDPQVEKRQQRNAATLEDLWETYRKAVVKRPRTMVEDAGLWNRYLSPWASKRLADITDEAVQKLHNRLAEGKLDRKVTDSKGHTRTVNGGATAARLTMALLSGMFTECGKTFGVTVNPARGVRKEKTNAKERYLSAEELPAFWSALAGQSEGMRDLFKVALFTAQRRTTLLSMRWDEVNLTFNVWTIPADKMKSGKAHVVPLVAQAVEILQRRKDAATKGAVWVFPGPGETGHVQEMKKALAAVVTASKLPHFTLHDLRRSAATWMNSTGASLSTIQAVLAQRPQSVAGLHYIKSTADNMRQALQTAVDAMETAATGIVPAKPAAPAATAG